MIQRNMTIWYIIHQKRSIGVVLIQNKVIVPTVTYQSIVHIQYSTITDTNASPRTRRRGGSIPITIRISSNRIIRIGCEIDRFAYTPLYIKCTVHSYIDTVQFQNDTLFQSQCHTCINSNTTCHMVRVPRTCPCRICTDCPPYLGYSKQCTTK